jgi:hypothetical protein
MLVLVLLDAPLGEMLHLNPEGKLVNKQLVKVVDLIKQMAFRLGQIAAIGLMVGVNLLQRLDSQKSPIQHNESFPMKTVCKSSNFFRKKIGDTRKMTTFALLLTELDIIIN